MDPIEYNGYALGAIDAKAEKALGTVATAFGFANVDALLYVLDYGFRQALADPIAGLRAKMEKEKDESGERKFTEADIEAALRSKQDKRFADLLAGTVGSRSAGPRLKPLDKIAFEIGIDQLKRVFAKLNRKFPSGEGAAEQIRLGVQDIWDREPRFKAVAYQMAQKRLDEEAALMADFDIGSFT